jgi:hypothetical protein
MLKAIYVALRTTFPDIVVDVDDRTTAREWLADRCDPSQYIAVTNTTVVFQRYGDFYGVAYTPMGWVREHEDWW